MELADAVADLVRIHGTVLLVEAQTFRGALDDYLDEATAPSGTVKLLTDAVELGALDSLVMMLDQGAEVRSAIDMVGDRLARDRGSADLAGSRWACAVLGYAVGRVPAEVEADLRSQVVLPTSTLPTPTTTQRLSTADPPAEGGTRVIHEEPAPDGGRDPRRPWALVASAAAVVGILAAVVLAIVVLDDGDGGSPGGDGDTTSEEEELARQEVTTEDSGIETTFRVMLDGTDAYLVMELGTGDDLEETARVELSCSFVEGSKDTDLDVGQGVQGLGPDAGDGLVGWYGPIADTSYAEYFQWDAKAGMLELLGVEEGQECPAAP